MSLVQAAQSGIPIQDFISPGLPGQVLKDGAELISLGLNGEKIQMILQERVHQATERKNRVANTLKSLAKYPPAFGLAGTVLGLVSLMRSVSAGATAKDTAVEMAIALVATMYGILTANLVVNPAGESVAKDAIEEMKEAEIAVQAVLLAVNRTSILESQEMLNSFVLPQDRVNVLGGGIAPESNGTSESEAA